MNHAARWARVIGAAALVTLSTLMVASPGNAQSSGSADASGLESLVECVARTQKIAAVVLIDESSSLKNTDADDQRVGMVEALVDALIDISRVPVDGIESELDLAIVGFSSAVVGSNGAPVTLSDWMPARRDTDDQITSAILGFADRKSGSETDYVTALATAQDLLIQRQADIGVPSGSLCTAILWFTDGKFDLGVNSQARTWTDDLDLQNSPSDREEAVRRGTDLLCTAGGVADQLRSASTHLLTFALLSDRFEGADEALLLQVTLGADGCGTIDGSATGAYFPGRVPDGIADCFYLALQGRGCPPTPAEPGQCTTTGPCVRTFTIDDAIGSVRLEYAALPDLSSTVLRAPSGTEVPLSIDDTTTLPGVEVRVSAATRAGFATLIIDDGNSAAHGRWEVVSRPDEPGSLDLSVVATPTYRLKLDVPDDAVRGEAFTVFATITGRSGQPIDPSTVAGLGEVLFTVADGGPSPRDVVGAATSDGTFTAQITLDTRSNELTASLVAYSDITRDGGSVTELRSTAQTISAISPGFIRVLTNSVDLGTQEATRAPDSADDHSQVPLPITATITDGLEFIAPRDTGGTACIDDMVWEIGRPALTLTPERECVAIPAGESATLDLQLAFDEPVAGPLNGVLPITLTSDLDGSQATVDVPVGGQVRIPPPVPWSNSGVRLVLLLVGLLAPSLSYVIAALYLTRFTEPTLVQFAVFNASIQAHSVAVVPVRSGDDDLTGFHFLQATSREAIAGALILRAPRRIVGEPVATVTSGLGDVLVTSARPEPLTGRSEIGHEIGGHWVFSPTGCDGDNITGQITVFVRDLGDAAMVKANELVANAQSDLARHRDTLKSLFSGSLTEVVDGGTPPIDTDYKW